MSAIFVASSSMRAYDLAPGCNVFIEINTQKCPEHSKMKRKDIIQAEDRVSLYRYTLLVMIKRDYCIVFWENPTHYAFKE